MLNQMGIHGCFTAMKQTTRIPMAMDIIVNIGIAMKGLVIKLYIDQRQDFLAMKNIDHICHQNKKSYIA